MEQDFSFDPESEESPIQFHAEDCSFELLAPERISSWISMVLQKENQHLSFLNIIFCSDSYLHQLNLEYLDHDTLTDIITFPYDRPPNIEGDIFISIDRVRENASSYSVSFEEELLRVIIHGVLHLCGYSDKSPENSAQMRLKENEAILLYQSVSPS